MARTRSVTIRESVDELDQLRQFYSGRPEARRLLFLLLLKEDSSRTVSEAAIKARISERRGRYWWDSYRRGGLQELLDRRIWRKSELKEEVEVNLSGSQGEGTDSIDQRNWVAFLNAIATNSREIEDVRQWIVGFRAALAAFLGDVDYIVMNVRSGINVLEVGSGRIQAYQQYGDANQVVGSGISRSSDYRHYYEMILEKGKASGFPLQDYHAPPAGFDSFLEPGKRDQRPDDENDTFLASIVLLRKTSNPPISQASLDLMERVRPFVVYTVTDFLVRSALGAGKSVEIEMVVRKVGGKANLTQQESRVLFLAFLGHTYQEIAEQLHVSINTVQTHIRSIYRKTGVSKIGEVFARFFTDRSFPDEAESEY